MSREVCVCIFFSNVCVELSVRFCVVQNESSPAACSEAMLSACLTLEFGPSGSRSFYGIGPCGRALAVSVELGQEAPTLVVFIELG